LANSIIQLAPAQLDFLTKHIAGFSVEKWILESGGQAGSDRRFIRVCDATRHRSFMLILWDSNDKDWERFIGIQHEISGVVAFLPQIHAVDAEHGLILEEDLGSITLHAHCRQHLENDSEIEQIYRKAIDALIDWQAMPVTASAHLAARAMDVEMFLWESDYFSLHCVTEYFGNEKLLNPEWQTERHTIAEDLAKFSQVCIHRDFQSENILVKDGAIRFVDYQGARLGPAGYDLASLLYDPYAETLNATLIVKLVEYYRSKSPRTFNGKGFVLCAISRLMQALGAYSNLSLHKGKDRYRQFVPVALNHLSEVLSHHAGLPCLKEIVAVCLKASKG
jgi:N-acetylmuramate 1-kinase